MQLSIPVACACLSLAMSVAACCSDDAVFESLGGDTSGDDDSSSSSSSNRRPFVDEWELAVSGPADALTKLSVGGRLTSDNFANRGDIEVAYVEGTDQVSVEMQRFTIASGPEHAANAFSRMSLWAYDLDQPQQPSDQLAALACWAPGTSACQVRAYYDGLFQPVRDGVNFRVTIPRGWSGELELTTNDNLEEGVDAYPDRGDIRVDGLAGDLSVDMESGVLQIALDPDLNHYAGCPANDECVASDYAPGCGCAEPTNITVTNTVGAAANMTVDVADPSRWYTLALANHGDIGQGGPSCAATIDCGSFTSCELDPDFAAMPWAEFAEINYPGPPALPGAGVHISLTSDDCRDISYASGPEDYESAQMPVEHRGDLEVCVGCLEL